MICWLSIIFLYIDTRAAYNAKIYKRYGENTKNIKKKDQKKEGKTFFNCGALVLFLTALIPLYNLWLAIVIASKYDEIVFISTMDLLIDHNKTRN